MHTPRSGPLGAGILDIARAEPDESERSTVDDRADLRGKLEPHFSETEKEPVMRF